MCKPYIKRSMIPRMSSTKPNQSWSRKFAKQVRQPSDGHLREAECHRVTISIACWIICIVCLVQWRPVKQMSLQPKVLKVVEQRRSVAMPVKHDDSVCSREMWAFANRVCGSTSTPNIQCTSCFKWLRFLSTIYSYVIALCASGLRNTLLLIWSDYVQDHHSVKW